MDADPLTIAEQVASVLDRLNLSYAVGGAVGGSIFGEPRATNDLDLVVQVGADAADALFDGSGLVLGGFGGTSLVAGVR